MENIEIKTNDRKEIIGWMTYDWANSAFFTTVIGVLIGPYLIGLAEAAVGEDGLIVDLYLFRVTAKGLPSFCLALAVISMVAFLPLLGAIADYTNLKKRLMMAFTTAGVLASAGLFFVTDSYVWCSVLLIISNMTFAGANVFYNAFLIDIATEDKRDKVSSWGYAAGYIGGVIMLLINLYMINNAKSLGMTTGEAVRWSFLSAALWWGLFSIITFTFLRSRGATKVVPENTTLVRIGFKEIWETLKELRRLKQTMRFLIGYLFYNDGIQTVILMSSAFLSNELFTREQRTAKEDQAFLIGIFIVAQIAAFFGAVIFERISRFIGAKRTIIIALIIWCGIVIFAYGFLRTTYQAWIMGAFIGMVLGAAQALSRSLYSQMIPAGRESSFFGLYEISEKGTSWMGQILFTIIIGATGSFRQAILGLIVFFVVGCLILFFTDTRKAIHEAGNLTPEEAADKAPA
jgi:MFS transporter, UMF1 family